MIGPERTCVAKGDTGDGGGPNKGGRNDGAGALSRVEAGLTALANIGTSGAENELRKSEGECIWHGGIVR